MAALNLHNAVFMGHPAEPSTPPVALHSRTVSTTTLRTLADADWHPAEPLFGRASPASEVYRDLLARQPSHPSEPQQSVLYLTGDHPTEEERRWRQELAVKRRLSGLGNAKVTLLVIKGVWATYNIVRYIISYLRLASSEAATLSFVLALLVTFSLAFLLSAILLTIFQPQLLLSYAASQHFRTTRTIFHSLSSVSLFAPAVVNFAFVFQWRQSLVGRCHLDVDVIWSASSELCNPAPPWRIWVALAALRMVLTAMLLVAYHLLAHRYHRTRRPSSRRFVRVSTSPTHPHEPQSQSEPSISAQGTFSSLPQRPPFVMTLHSPRHSRSSSHIPSPSLRSSRSDPSSRISRMRHMSDPAVSRQPSSDTVVTSDPPEEESQRQYERELQAVASLSRMIVRQMVRNTSEGVNLSESTGSGQSITADVAPQSGDEDAYFPYVMDLTERNRRLRRMSTIISVGSREAQGTTSSLGRRNSNSTHNGTHSQNRNGVVPSASRSPRTPVRDGASIHSRTGSLRHSPGLSVHEEGETVAGLREVQSLQGCSCSGESCSYGDCSSPSSRGRGTSSLSHSGHEAQRT